MLSFWEVFAKCSFRSKFGKVAVNPKLFRRKQEKNKNAEIEHGVCAIAWNTVIVHKIWFITPSTWSEFTTLYWSTSGKSLANRADVAVARMEIANSDKCRN